MSGPRRNVLASLVVAIFCFAGGTSSSAQVMMKQEEALRLAFSGEQAIERQTLFLTEKQAEDIQKLSRSLVESKLVVYYRSRAAGKVTGYAFFETAIVRTKPATLMVAVNSDSSLRRVEVLSFYEPLDYLPAPRWLSLFRNKTLGDGLWPRRDIHHVTGATLTTRAITLAVRRMLAIYVVAVPKEERR